MVTDLSPSRDGTIVKNVTDDVRAFDAIVSPARSYAAVSVGVESPLPFPALIPLLDASPKTLFKRNDRSVRMFFLSQATA